MKCSLVVRLCHARGCTASETLTRRRRLWSAVHVLTATQQLSLSAHGELLQQQEKNKQAMREQELQMQHEKKTWQASLDASTAAATTAAAAAAAAATELAQAESKLDAERALVRTCVSTSMKAVALTLYHQVAELEDKLRNKQLELDLAGAYRQFMASVKFCFMLMMLVRDASAASALEHEKLKSESKISGAWQREIVIMFFFATHIFSPPSNPLPASPWYRSSMPAKSGRA